MPSHWFTAMDCDGGAERYRLHTGESPDGAAYRKAWEEGRAMKLDHVIAYALSDG
jgi:hypothetical protein